MINFNSSHLYTLPSYSMQSMFSQALGDYVVTSSLEDAGARAAGSRKAVASVKGDTLIWKATNYVSAPQRSQRLATFAAADEG